jgi:hypothetical protein
MTSLGLDDQADIGIAVGLAGTFRSTGGATATATAIYSATVSTRFYETFKNLVSQLARYAGYPASNFSLLLDDAKLKTAAAYSRVLCMADSLQAATSMTVKVSYVSGSSLSTLLQLFSAGQQSLQHSLLSAQIRTQRTTTALLH